MNTLIQTVEAAIKSEKWSVEYHTDKLAEHTDRMLTLALELAELKVKLDTPNGEHEQNSFNQIIT